MLQGFVADEQRRLLRLLAALLHLSNVSFEDHGVAGSELRVRISAVITA